MNLKGTKTEANLQAHLPGNHRQGINIPISHPKRKKTVMYKLLQFLKRRQIMKKNMRKCGTSFCTAASAVRWRI